jgi:tetratricopeptide (TPR) repeat protein
VIAGVAAGLVLAALLATQPPSPTSASAPARAASVPDRAALLARAAEAQQRGQVDEAMRLLRIAADKLRSVQAHLELARLQSRGKQPAEALATLTRARELAPNAEEVLGAYAQVALAIKQPPPAVLALRALTRMCPSVGQYHYLLGVGLMAIGDMPGAGDALAEADRLEPERALTLLALGLVRNDRKQYADAKLALLRSVDLQPESVEAVAALAEAEAGLGDLDAAARHAQRALERAPASATANMVMGLVRMEQRDYPGARDALLKAADADPQSARVAYQLSLVYARLGDDASAKRYLGVYQTNLKAVEERIAMLRAGGALADPAVKKVRK